MKIAIEKGTLEDRRDDVLVRFTTDNKELVVDPAPVGSGARYLITAGLGLLEDIEAETVREATGNVLQETRRLKAASVCFDSGLVSDMVPAIQTAVTLFTYNYAVFKKPSENKKFPGRVTVLVAEAKKIPELKHSVESAQNILAGVTLARDLVNTPGEFMHPDALVSAAREISKKSKGRIRLKVLDQAACAKLGMGAYLAVGKGSAFASQFIHLTYTPSKKPTKSLAVVGKGVTFDSGGLSLKPADSMMTMKCDMAGAAAVLGLFSVLPDMAPNVEVHGIIAACENMPSGKAMRPGDVVTASNGKTIEVANTDAEGRLTLADALTYAVKLNPDAIIDLATLTGACVVSLGEEIAGLMSNDDDLEDALEDAAEITGEKIWELPLPKRYRALIESDVADLRNIATSRYGGTLTAGLFLQEFVDDVPWAHLDIAGPAFAERPLTSYIGKGGTGFAVRTLAEFVANW